MEYSFPDFLPVKEMIMMLLLTIEWNGDLRIAFIIGLRILNKKVEQPI